MDVALWALAPGVAPRDALAWWFDFREGRTDHRFLGVPVRRRILARSPDEVEMEDRAPLFRERTHARRGADAVVFSGVNTFSRFAGAYRFEAAPGGTRIALKATIALRGALRPGLPIARPLVRAILQRDLDGHARELAQERGQDAPHTG